MHKQKSKNPLFSCHVQSNMLLFIINVERDKKNIAELLALGWNVIIVWECELKKPKKDERLDLLAAEILQNQS